jgi:CRISPR system Cascade subunit CasB
MTEFVAKLEEWSANDSRVRAVLRRSLSFAPGEHPPAFPYVEWFLKGDESTWRRAAHYLVAGVWAAHWRQGRSGEQMPFGKACAALRASATGSESVERRFVNLLDADLDQLPHRLRQMMALLKDFNLDYEALLKGLLYWNDDRKRSQNQWARDFYRSFQNQSILETITNEEDI